MSFSKSEQHDYDKWNTGYEVQVDEVDDDEPVVLSDESKTYLKKLRIHSPQLKYDTLTTDRGHAAEEEQRRLQRERDMAKSKWRSISPASWFKGGRRKKYTRRYKKLKKQSRTKKRKQNRKRTSKKGTNRKRNSRKTYHR
jgi:hypothetical protein